MKRTTIALCLFVLLLNACNRKKNTPEKDPYTYYAWNKFSMGVDLSYVNQVEDYGGVYRDSAQVHDVFRIMKAHGGNTVRVRLWHTPTWIADLNNGNYYYDLPGVEKTIRRAKEAGMAVNLDIHYSDRWADPDHQEIPAAWKNLSTNLLADSVYQYTLAVLTYLKNKNLVPEMVQVGNETNSGMLWPAGKTDSEAKWANFALFLNSGIRAVRDFSANTAIKPKIIVHVAQLQHAAYWTQMITQYNVKDYDILGLSHYVKWSTLQTMKDVETTISSLKKTYGKEIMIVETAYPWTGENADSYTNIISSNDTLAGYPATPAGQAAYLKDLVQSIIRGGGTGIMYWEPAWISSGLNDGWGKGSSWENNAFFDFNGNTLPAIDFMRQPYTF